MADKEPSQILFEGEESSVYYVSYLPEHLVTGGPWLIRLSINDTHQLLFGYVAIDHQLSWQANMQAEFNQIILLNEVEQLEIRYLSAQDLEREGEWQASWLDKTVLPRSIKIQIIQNKHIWPEIVEPIYSSLATRLPMYTLPSNR